MTSCVVLTEYEDFEDSEDFRQFVVKWWVLVVVHGGLQVLWSVHGMGYVF